MSPMALTSRLRERSGLLVSAAILPLTFWIGGARHPGWHPPTGWNLLLVLMISVVILGREHRPLTVLGIVAVLDTLRAIAIGHPASQAAGLPFATMLALYTVSANSSTRVAWSSALSVAALQFVVSVARYGYTPTELLYINWALVGTVLGRLSRERHDRLAAAEQRATTAEQSRQAEADRQVTAERIRIARDLHDVLAHHISVVNAQAGVAQYLLRTDPDAAERALNGITTNSRAALDELRVTLGLLREESDEADTESDRGPTPGVTQLDALLASFTDTGMDLTTTVYGNPESLAAAADLAIYRVAQEALSNATKHAPQSSVQLTLVWARHWVTLEVTNTGAPVSTTNGGKPAAGTGHGLVGMRERALAAGGTLTAAPTDAGGWQVKLALPTGTRSQ